MMDNIYFRAWVANAVHAVSGIWPLDWQGSHREWPLTCEEIRMVDWQSHECGDVVWGQCSLNGEVLTNKRLLH